MSFTDPSGGFKLYLQWIMLKFSINPLFSGFYAGVTIPFFVLLICFQAYNFLVEDKQEYVVFASIYLIFTLVLMYSAGTIKAKVVVFNIVIVWFT